jgi:FAD/FMN-containing dehydrogenase
VNFEVVLADGQVANANATSNDDLWRALKGGSNNFGIVTRFDVRAFEQGNFWGGIVLYNDSASPLLLEAFDRLVQEQASDDHAAMIHSHVYVPGMGFVVVANMEYTKPLQSPRILRSYIDAQPQLNNSMRISNLTDFTDEFVAGIPDGNR